jgi:hypothetical protein
MAAGGRKTAERREEAPPHERDPGLARPALQHRERDAAVPALLIERRARNRACVDEKLNRIDHEVLAEQADRKTLGVKGEGTREKGEFKSDTFSATC